MSIKGFKIWPSKIHHNTPMYVFLGDPKKEKIRDDIQRGFHPWICQSCGSPDELYYHLDLKFHTGTFDRNGTPIYEGDTLRQKSCEIPFVVEDIVSFLIMCGKYEAKHGTPIFDSLEVVS